MSKIVVSVIGLDCPGVVYTVASTLSALECNIEEVSQTILENQFAGIIVVSRPEDLDNERIRSILFGTIEDKDMHLSVTIRDFEEGCRYKNVPTEPFVVTVDGEDRLEILASITRIFAEHRVNIANLKAVKPSPGQALIVVEVDLPLTIDRSAFRKTLQDRASSLGLRLSMQHRDIFEAMHRVLSV